MGIEVKTSADVKRTDNIEGLGQVSTIPDVFAKPVGAVVGPFAVVGGRGVAKDRGQDSRRRVGVDNADRRHP